MSEIIRRNHYDVTDTVFVGDPTTVADAIRALLQQMAPDIDPQPLDRAFALFTDLYTGDLSGYLGCDTWYHDAQHSLDSALTLARLLDGYQRCGEAGPVLTGRRCLLGLIVALFHDAGYVRRIDDTAENGAEFTACHVRRSGDFLARFLPELGFGAETELARHLVHFTGYEIALDDIEVADPGDRVVGFLLGTADLVAQMSDRCYLEKCRDCLYYEFEICGMAGPPRPEAPEPIFASPEALLQGTPGFVDGTWRDRLDGYFQGLYRCESSHFGGHTPYQDAIAAQRPRLDYALADGDIHSTLRRRVECINSLPLREIVGRDPNAAPIETTKRPPRSRLSQD